MEKGMEERLPQVVEDRLQEAYRKIQKGEIKQMKKKTGIYRRWTGAAAACAVIVTASVGALAAAAYFQKEVRQEADTITYEFNINYELVPGEYKITPEYLPEGYEDHGGGKYYGEDALGITVMPIYTTAELDKVDGEIGVTRIENVEHTTLSGMEADIITFQEAEKYQSPTYIFLFNEAEGYVLQIIGEHPVSREDLLKFADNLSVERIGDGAYETAEERTAREQEEDSEEALNRNSANTWQKLLESGIPTDKLHGLGEELRTFDGTFGYTVTDYEYLDSIEGFEEDKFFEFSRFDGWLNEDKTLKPYTRLLYDTDGQLLEEEQAEQRFLRVDMTVHCYDNSALEDVPLDFALEYVRPQGSGFTWAREEYSAVPEEHYTLQMDNSAVYLDVAVHTEGEDRKDYFFRHMENGEELSYTLLFVVDKDREGDFLLSPVSGNYSLAQTPVESAEQILEELDGYIQLK